MIVLGLALELWAFAFFGFFGSELLGAYPTLRITAQVLFAVPLAVWAVSRLRGPASRLDWAVALALVAMAVVSLASVDRQGSLESLGLALAYALGFWLLRDIGARPRLRTAVAVAASIAFLFWLVMVSAWWLKEKLDWVAAVGTAPNLESNQVFIWGTANAFPILSLLTVGFLAWLPPGVPRRLLVLVWGVTAVVVIPLSVGRAAWLGFAVAVIAYEALGGFPHVRGVAGWFRARHLLRPAAAVATVIVLGIVVVAVLKGETVLAANLSDRLRIWSEAVGIFSSDPLTGGGPSTFSWLRLTHVPDYTYAVPVRLTHNVFFETLADGGIVLLLGFGVLLVAFADEARHRLADPRRRLTAAVLVGFAAASLLDDFSSLPAVMAAVIALAAWTVTEEAVEALPGARPAPVRPGMFALALLAGLLAIAAIPNVAGVDRARLAAADARDAAVAGDWTRAEARFAVATESYPTDAGYWLGLGLSRWRVGDVAAARAAYERAGELSPGDARSWGALAALETRPDRRAALLDRASRLTITDSQYALRLGDALRAANRPSEALHAYAIAVAIDPATIRVLLGRNDPSMPASKVAAEASSLAAPLHDGDASVVTWDLDLALGRLPRDAGPAWQAVNDAAAGDLARARTEADQALALEPYYGYGLPARVAVSLYECDRSTYERLTSVAGHLRPTLHTGVAIVREHTYREDGLGDYQPLDTAAQPAELPWPWSIIGPPPSCPGWSP